MQVLHIEQELFLCFDAPYVHVKAWPLESFEEDAKKWARLDVSSWHMKDEFVQMSIVKRLKLLPFLFQPGRLPDMSTILMLLDVPSFLDCRT